MTDSSFALALAAGGARGAYQAGALLALAEHGFRFHAVAGTSIGTLNGAFYVQGDGSAGHQEMLCERWRESAKLSPLQLHPELGDIFGKDGSGIDRLFNSFLRGDLSLFHSQPITEMVDRWLDYDAICRSPIPFVLAVLPETTAVWDIITGAERQPHYLTARDLGAAELRAALLAATAIPLALPGWKVQGKSYSDAGLSMPLPLRRLYEDGHRRLLGILLGARQRCEPSDFPEAVCHLLRPSQMLDGDWVSMFDFSPRTVDRRIDLGYKDATAALTTYLPER